jgi:hypothetical protein
MSLHWPLLISSSALVGGWTRHQHPESSLVSHRTSALVCFCIFPPECTDLNLPSLVDGPLSNSFNWFIDISATMLLDFLAVVYITPVFSVPGIAIAVLGAWLGRVYMKAQIAIKREMSNAKAPVLGHFGASVAGISASSVYHFVMDVGLTSSKHPSAHMAHNLRSAKNRTGGSIGTRGPAGPSTI